MNPIVVSTICAAAQYITSSGVTFIFSGEYFFLSSSKFPIHCYASYLLILLLLVKQSSTRILVFDHFALLAGGVFNCEGRKDPIRGTHHYARGIQTPIQCNLVKTESFRSKDYTEVHMRKPFYLESLLCCRHKEYDFIEIIIEFSVRRSIQKLC